MRRFLILSLIIILSLAGCSLKTNTLTTKTNDRSMKQLPPPSFMPKDISIVSAGDSLTKGVGDTKNQGGYISYLKNLLETKQNIKNANFQNFGVKGNRTDQLLKRLKESKIKTAIEEANLVVITIGGNDVMQVFKDNLTGLTVDKFVAAEEGYSIQLREIIQTISSYNSHAEIIIVGIYNPFIKWFSDIKEMEEIVVGWNETSMDIVADFDQTTFIPVADIFLNNEESLLYTDYFHPNNRGYELMAERIYSNLEKEGILNKILK